MALHQRGELDKAVELYLHVLRHTPSDARTLNFLAQAQALLGREEQAIESNRRAVALDPGSVYLRQQLASSYVSAGRSDEAVDVWRDLVKATNGAWQARASLASQLASARRAREALQELESLDRDHPDIPIVCFELSRMHERMGDTISARRHANRFAALAPGQPDGVLALARLDAHEGKLIEARRALEALASAEATKARGDIHRELALVLDKLGEHHSAFLEAAQAQSANFAALPAHQKTGELHERVIAGALALTKDEVATWATPAGVDLASIASESPIFVVGFPRSGTTLVEQMLSAHPRLAVTDELPILQRVRQQMYEQFQPKGEYPRDLGKFTSHQIAKGREWYMTRARRSVPRAAGAAGGRSRRVVDKQPLNTVDLAVIRLLFPESPVISVRRDPRDTVLSVFLQGFTRGVPHLFSLDGAARLYDLFAQVYQHDKAVLGQRTLDVRYEDVAREPEREARRMLEFVGEAWDDRVMRFHEGEHRRYVTTPSFADVAQPVYTRAIGRWKNYQAELAPVMGVLGRWVEGE